MQLPILHLGHINPHVATALQNSPSLGQFQMMRQQGGMLTSAGRTDSKTDGALRCGVSAFAFQGTNAHAIIEQSEPHSTAQSPDRHRLLWQKNEHWIALPAHALLNAVVTSTDKPKMSAITFVADLSSARAATLVQGLQVHGQTVFSLDLYTELMLGAMQQVNSSSLNAHLHQVATTGLSAHCDSDSESVSQVTVQLSGSGLEIHRFTPDTASYVVHCQAKSGQLTSAHHSCGGSPSGRPTAVQSLLRSLMSQPVLTQAAATAAVSEQSPTALGFCLPSAVFSASSQLQTALHITATTAAVVPTAVASVSTYPAQSQNLSLQIIAASTAPQLCNAAVSHDSCLTNACQLNSIQMTAAEALSTSSAASDKTDILYEVQWKAVAPQLPTAQTTTCQVPSHCFKDPVGTCALLIAQAQQAMQLNIQQPDLPSCAQLHRKLHQFSLDQRAGKKGSCCLSLDSSHANSSSSKACKACKACQSKSVRAAPY